MGPGRECCILSLSAVFNKLLGLGLSDSGFKTSMYLYIVPVYWGKFIKGAFYLSLCLELSIELRRVLISWFSSFSFQTAGFAGMHNCKRVGTRLFYKWDRAVDDMANVFTSPFKVHLCCGIYQKFIPFHC